MLESAGKKVSLCGNLGTPLSDCLTDIDKNDWMIIEVSSFQLEHIKWFKPQVSVILNITQNHFDHHKDMSDYAKAKAKIFKNQKHKDFLVLNAQDSKLRRNGSWIITQC